MTARHKASLDQCLGPLARTIARAGISPDAITLLGVVLSVIICFFFVWTRAVLPFCVAITLAAALDGLDGAVARASGRATRVGAYLDAVADRLVEAMVVLATAVVTGYWLLSTLVLVGSMLISYTKARAAMEIPISNLEWPDLMERTERDLLFILGLAASRLLPWHPLGHDLFWWTLVLLAVLIVFTVCQRVRRACRFIRERSPH